jgi:hypothetical protein
MISAERLSQCDDDALGAADVTEPIAVLVLRHLANELRAAGSQASDDGVDVVDQRASGAEGRIGRRLDLQRRPAQVDGQVANPALRGG